MIYIKFYNAYGHIEMGGTKSDLWRIGSISGLEPVEAGTNSVSYVGIPGETTLEVQLKPRTITITGSLKIFDKTQRQRHISKGAAFFDPMQAITMICDFNGKRRRLECRPVSFKTEHYNAIGQAFTLTVKADYPYFKDWVDTKDELYNRVDTIIDGFTLPDIFTYRYDSKTIQNRGSVDIEPIIYITAGATGTGAQGITITNITTGASIVLNYSMVKEEQITIDISNRKIVSSANGDITHRKSKTTLLRLFVLAKGNNTISFSTVDASQYLTAQIEYSNRYIEGVY